MNAPRPERHALALCLVAGTMACTGAAPSPTTVRRPLPAGAEGDIRLGEARMFVPAGTTREDTTAEISRTEGVAGQPAYAFSLGGVPLHEDVRLELPASGPGVRVPLLAFADGDGVWRTEPAAHDRARGVLVADVRHLSVWSEFPVTAVAGFVRDRVGAITSARADRPVCDGQGSAREGIRLAVREDRDGVEACSFVAGGTWRLRVVNSSSGTFRVTLRDARVGSTGGVRGAATDRVVRALRDGGRGEFVPPGGTVEFVATGKRPQVRLEPDPMFAVATVVADAFGLLKGPIATAVSVVGAGFDCFTARGGSVRDVANATRTLVDCAAAAATTAGRVPRALVRLPRDVVEVTGDALAAAAAGADLPGVAAALGMDRPVEVPFFVESPAAPPSPPTPPVVVDHAPANDGDFECFFVPPPCQGK